MIDGWPWNVRGVYFRRDLSAWLAGREMVTARPIVRGLPASLSSGEFSFFRLGGRRREMPADIEIPEDCSWICGFFREGRLIGCLSDGRLAETRIQATPGSVSDLISRLSFYDFECDGVFLEDGTDRIRYIFREGVPGRILEAMPFMDDLGRIGGKLRVMRRGHEARVFCMEPRVWDSFMPGPGDMILLDEGDRLLFCIEKGNAPGMPWPTTCPWCGFALRDGACGNPACMERKKASLRLFCNVLQIDVPRKDFFGLANLEDGSAGPWSAFLMPRGKLLERFSGHCLDAIGRRKRQFRALELRDVLEAFAIPGIRGREALISPQIMSLAELAMMKERNLSCLPGIADAKDAFSWLSERRAELCAISSLFRTRRAVRKPKLGFSGVFPWPAKMLRKAALDAGFLVASRQGAEDMAVTASGEGKTLPLEEFLSMLPERERERLERD